MTFFEGESGTTLRESTEDRAGALSSINLTLGGQFLDYTLIDLVNRLLLIIAMVMGHSVLMADIKDPTQSAIIEKAIRSELKKPAGELTKANFEKVRELNLDVSSADRFRAGARMKDSSEPVGTGIAFIRCS